MTFCIVHLHTTFPNCATFVYGYLFSDAPDVFIAKKQKEVSAGNAHSPEQLDKLTTTASPEEEDPNSASKTIPSKSQFLLPPTSVCCPSH